VYVQRHLEILTDKEKFKLSELYNIQKYIDENVSFKIIGPSSKTFHNKLKK
jgi:hypothetical protein